MQRVFVILRNSWKRNFRFLDKKGPMMINPTEEETGIPQGVKRQIETDNVADAKKPKQDGSSEKSEMKLAREAGLPYQKKKCALLMMYSGKGYFGMQIQKGQDGHLDTIEKDLFDALVKSGVVLKSHVDEKRMDFQRAARTDKGVSAVGQLCSLKMFVDVEDPVEKINTHLPEQIRCLDIFRTTKNFDSKNSCSGRSYFYLIPSFAFAPLEEVITEDYRITDEIVDSINNTLKLFIGTHNFFNYTSGRKANDPSCKRYITEFSCSKPFIQGGFELLEITVRGQSFILHQIRKMIGITIACKRGLCTEEAIEKSWGAERVDIPRAPGLGLVLDRTHYDLYNKRFGSDGIHKAIDWENYKSEINDFKKQYIFSEIINTEKNEKSMLMWLSDLPIHSFDVVPEEIKLSSERSARTMYGEARTHLSHSRQKNSEPANEEPINAESHAIDVKGTKNSEDFKAANEEPPKVESNDIDDKGNKS